MNTIKPLLIIVTLYIINSAQALELTALDLSVADNWQTVEILGDYIEPIVVTGAITRNDSNSVVAQVRNITQDSFDIRIVDWGTSGLHTAIETVNCLVIEAGRQTIGGLIFEAGKKTDYTSVAINAKEKTAYQSFTFSSPINKQVDAAGDYQYNALSQVVGELDSESINVRHHYGTDSNSVFQFCFEKGNNAIEPAQVEELHYVLIQSGKTTDGFAIPIESFSTARLYDDDPKSVAINTALIDPIVMVNAPQIFGTDSTAIRIVSQSPGELSILADEATGWNGIHTTEALSVIVFGTPEPDPDPDANFNNLQTIHLTTQTGKITSHLVIGVNATATGEGSLAIGTNAQANADNSLALGENAITQGNTKLAVDGDVNIDGNLSVTGDTMVNGAIESTVGGFVLPDGTVIDEAADLGGGLTLTEIGTGLGVDLANNESVITTNTTNSSTNWGIYNTASGDYSTAWGRYSTASGSHSTALGYANAASGSYSIAWGDNNEASGRNSTVWGDSNIANGSLSTVWGELSIASGRFSTAWGVEAKAESFASTALGQYNIGGFTFLDDGNDYNDGDWEWFTNDSLFEIGNGIDNANRANALTILKSGKIGVGLWGDDLYDTTTAGKNTADSLLRVAGAIESTTGGIILPDGTVIDEAADLGGSSTASGSELVSSEDDSLVAIATTGTDAATLSTSITGQITIEEQGDVSMGAFATN